MKDKKSSFTTEKPVDYMQSKDAYDGTLNSTKNIDPSHSKEESKNTNKNK